MHLFDGMRKYLYCNGFIKRMYKICNFFIFKEALFESQSTIFHIHYFVVIVMALE